MTHPPHGRRAAARPRRTLFPRRDAAPRQRRTARTPLRPAMSIAAMSIAGGMLLATSVPALAVNATDTEVRASVYAPAQDAVSQRSQSLEVSNEATLEPIDVGEWDVEAAPPPIESSVAGIGEVSLLESPRIVWPVDPSRISDGFGPRSAPCGGCSSDHDGIDFNPGAGAPIVSIADGVVITATEAGGGYGAYVEVQHNINGVMITSLYAHMQYGSISVSAGQRVSAGDLLGAVGSTGQSTGPHLHLEMYGADGVRFDGLAWLHSNVTG